MNVKKCLALSLVFLFGAPLGKAQTSDELIRQLAGYKAMRLCGGLFIQDLSIDDAHAQVLRTDPRTKNLTYSVDQSRHSVTVADLKIATLKPGFGCVVSSIGKFDTIEFVDWDRPSPNHSEAVYNWPETDASPENNRQSLNIDEQQFNTAIKAAWDSSYHTNGILAVYKGKIVAEQYRKEFTVDTPHIGWSMSKSITSALVGIAAHQGYLDLSDQRLFPSWELDSRANISIRHLLGMASGLEWYEAYGDENADVGRMLFDSLDTAHYATQKPLANTPGTAFNYSTGTTNILQKIIRDRISDDRIYHNFPKSVLFDVIGMTSVEFGADAAGTYIGGAYVWASLRDWTRFGLLYLNKGVWGKHQVIPESYIDYSLTSTPASNHLYGAQIWLNKRCIKTVCSKKWPELPSDSYVFLGFENQWIVVVPSLDFVYTRLGQDRNAVPVPAWVAKFIEALPSEDE